MDAIRKFVVELSTAFSEFIERQAGHVCVLLFLAWWGFLMTTWHIDYGQRLMDQATGALMYCMNVRKGGLK